MSVDGAGFYAPLHGVTPEDQGGADLIVCYVLIITTISFSIVRFGIGAQRLLQFDLDDLTFSVAVIFAILTSIITHLMVVNGLGQHQDALSGAEVNRFFKYSYSDMFLFITSTTFAKLSVLLLFRRIMAQSRAVQAFITLSALIALYFVFSIFANAFQCGATRPWVLSPSQCPTHGGLQYGIIGFNMLTDIMIAVWILPSLWKLQMSKNNRIIVMSLFGARFIVPLTCIGQIYLLYKSLQSEDQTWVQLPLTIINQVVVHLSVIHATLPRIHGFLSKLQSGMLATRVATTMPADSKDNSKASGGRHGSNPLNTIGSSQRGKRKIDGRLFVSSSSYDYPLPEEKLNGGYGGPADPDSIHPIHEEADGNFTDGLRLRPDIAPGSKWSTTIYSDHDSGNELPRQHSSSTKGDGADGLQMGRGVDDDHSQSSIYEDHHGSSAAAGAAGHAGQQHPPVPGVPSHIWKTKEFRYQVETMQPDGNLVDVTTRENHRGRGREMTEVA